MDEYDRMFDEQGGCCALCERPGRHTLDDVRQGEKLFVDHCHDTGRVRGLLCAACNTGLGHLGDRIPNLENALVYLRKNTSQSTLTN
jgi:DNA-binding sugar fermentation-stimulating protein